MGYRGDRVKWQCVHYIAILTDSLGYHSTLALTSIDSYKTHNFVCGVSLTSGHVLELYPHQHFSIFNLRNSMCMFIQSLYDGLAVLHQCSVVVYVTTIIE